jgi:hypothetical protein
MKTIRSQNIIELVARFDEARAIEKSVQAELKNMRESLIAAMGDEASAKAGEFLLLLSERVRTDLDKKALAADLGDKLKTYEKASTYQILEIKKA